MSVQGVLTNSSPASPARATKQLLLSLSEDRRLLLRDLSGDHPQKPPLEIVDVPTPGLSVFFVYSFAVLWVAVVFFSPFPTISHFVYVVLLVFKKDLPPPTVKPKRTLVSLCVTRSYCALYGCFLNSTLIPRGGKSTSLPFSQTPILIAFILMDHPQRVLFLNSINFFPPSPTQPQPWPQA